VLVHNNFQDENGIFPLFDGLEVADMEKPLHQTGLEGDAINGDTVSNGRPTNGSRKSTLTDLVSAAKSAASTVTTSLAAAVASG